MAQSSPSPSSWASSLHSKANTAGFRIPGPSTRFHKEHKQEVKTDPRPRYARFSSSVGSSYESPSIRARSRLSMSPSNASTSSIPRPDGSHRKSSSQSSYMAHTAPLTPVRSPHASAMNEYDSPFSDYFTDENRSVDDRAQYSTPSSESQRLLLRLNTLGAEILRHDLSDSATSDLEAKLDDLEAALSTPGARSSRSSRLSEAGLYISESGEVQEASQNTPQQSSEQTDRPSTPLPLDASADHIPVAVKARLRNQERLLKEAQDVLQRVSRANDSLRKRYEEIRQIHDNTVLELEEAAQEALMLKSENESLKSDLGFDHSELLFMKLQLKALEVEADTISQRLGDNTDLEKNKVLLNDDIERWKADWDDVDARLRSRREKHSVVSTTPEKLSSAARDTPKTDDHGNWRLDMCKKRHGRFQSITIKRFSDLKEADEDEEEDQETKEDDDEFTDPSSIPAPPVFTPKYCAQSTQTEEPFMTKAEWEKMKEEAEALALLLGDPRERDALITLEDAAEQGQPKARSHEADDSEDDEDDDSEFESGSEGDYDSDDDIEQEDEEVDVDDSASLRSIESAPRKTAWQELYDSLTSFAGMDRD